MANVIKMEVVTPERVVVQAEVDSLVAPAIEGYLGVLPGHAPLLTGLSIGVVRYRKGDQEECLSVCGGFMEVARDQVVILADTAEKAGEVDIDRALRAKSRAEERLRTRPEGLDQSRAEAALRRALARLNAADYQGNNH
jgi:F-type H+-transporting ATPase subunit epsilon